MARRTNSPLHTTILLALLAGAGYLAYEYLYVRKVLANAGAPATVSKKDRDQIREAVLGRFSEDECFAELTAMSYRAKEDHWRLDLVVADGCAEGARTLCWDVAEYLRDEFRLEVSVWAFDSAGREIAHQLP
jgi:hypothetical protein